MTDQQKAKEMYFSGRHTQREIAQAIGVSDKTIQRWIKQDAWDKLKQAANAMPCVIVDNLYNQLIALQMQIGQREGGKGIPTMQEAEITRKLINCITKMGSQHGLPTAMQVMMAFSTYTRPSDKEFSMKLLRYANSYFEAKGKNGIDPIEFTYEAPFPVADPDEMEQLKQDAIRQAEEYDQSLKEEINNTLVTEVNQPQTENCEPPTGDYQTNDKVTLGKVEGQDEPNEKSEDQSADKIENNELDISKEPSCEMQFQQASPETDGPDLSCLPQDIIRQFPSIPLHGGQPIFIGDYQAVLLTKDKVYDLRLKKVRWIIVSEMNWLSGHGYRIR